MRTHQQIDALFSWLDTFASSIEWDDVTGEWTVRPREPDYPAARGRSLRAAATAAMLAAERVDAAAAHRRYVLREAVRCGR